MDSFSGTFVTQAQPYIKDAVNALMALVWVGCLIIAFGILCEVRCLCSGKVITTVGKYWLLVVILVYAILVGIGLFLSVLLSNVCDPSPAQRIVELASNVGGLSFSGTQVHLSGSSVSNTTAEFLSYYLHCNAQYQNPLVFVDSMCQPSEGIGNAACTTCSCQAGPLLNLCGSVFEEYQKDPSACNAKDLLDNAIVSPIVVVTNCEAIDAAISELLQDSICHHFIDGLYSMWSTEAATACLVILLLFSLPQVEAPISEKRRESQEYLGIGVPTYMNKVPMRTNMNKKYQHSSLRVIPTLSMSRCDDMDGSFCLWFIFFIHLFCFFYKLFPSSCCPSFKDECFPHHHCC